MATKNILPASKMKHHKTLASWWSSSITDSILKDFKGRTTKNNESNHDDNVVVVVEQIVLNLASDEYSAVMNQDQLEECGVQYIKIKFQQEGRVIAVHAKRARGLMARYVAEKGILDLKDVKGFDLEGYSYVSSKSSKDVFVFDRKKPEGKPSATKRKGGKSTKATAKKTRTKR
jgi:cytoplasmic iron level regulating protein YaaA (DUF328/UPF0246 family)